MLPAALALTVGFYAVIIGGGIANIDAGDAIRIRGGVRKLAIALSSAVVLWISVAVLGAVLHLSQLPHLVGPLLLGCLTAVLGVLFGAFDFRTAEQRAQQLELEVQGA